MYLDILYFVGTLAYAIALAPTVAHVAQMPNKMPMSGQDYLVAQRVYRGWQFFGIPQVTAILATLLLTVRLAGTPRFVAALVAFLAITATLVVFLLRVLPVNKATQNWTVLPEDWQRARRRWEYGHAINCGLILIGLISLLLTL